MSLLYGYAFTGISCPRRREILFSKDVAMMPCGNLTKLLLP